MKQFGMIKKALVFVLSFGLLAGLAACGDKATSQSSDGTNVPSGGSEAVVSQPVGGNTGAPVQGEESWFRYTDVEGGVEITGYLGEEGNIIIPDTLGGKPVVSIGKASFHNNQIITSITIPDSVTNIGEEAFNGCESLEYVDMGNGVKEVAGKAFFICPKLKEIVFSSSLEKVGGLSFSTGKITDGGSINASLKSVTIPASLKEAGKSAFAGCGVIEVIVPGSLDVIPDDFLRYNTNLEKVIVENGITKISYEAFADCPSLKELYIPASVTEIEDMIYSMDMDFTIIAPSGSVGETYAIEYEIPYRNE